MYRVTPIYDGKDLLAKGVQMEAYSVEDNGKEISFNVFVFNSQPGIEINYKDGTGRLLTEKISNNTEKNEAQIGNDTDKNEEYILNTNTRKIHRKDCSSVKDIQKNNKEIYNGTKEYLIDNGYTECDRCKQ